MLIMSKTQAAAPENMEVSQKTPRKSNFDPNYMHNPPRIMPNYGKKRTGVLPKSNISRVLLYDNATQQQMLDVKLSHIKIEQNRVGRLLDLHKRSFVSRQTKRFKNLQEASVGRTHAHAQNGILPEITTERSNANESIKRVASNNSHRSPSINRTCRSALSVLDTVKLPEIDPEGENRHVIFKLKEVEGEMHIYHTVDDEEGIFTDVVPLHAFYPKTTEDPRFQGLESTLIPSTLHSDGYNELSPSFKRKESVLPEYLEEINKSRDLAHLRLSATI